MNNFVKRIITIILALIMISSSISVFAAEGDYPFSDFPDGWSREAVALAVDNGLLTGMGNGKIEPQSNLTRAQMAAIINRAFGAEIMADISEFTDVPEDAWYREDIAVAVNMQTLAGEGNGIMNPESDITRQEAFAILSRALVLETNKNIVADFTDGSELSDWAVGDVSALVANGYVSGYPDGTLNPRGFITREEFAQVMFNIFHTYISESGTYDSVNEVTGVMINTPDVTLKNVTVYGDLVLGDGVGKGSVTLANVKIKGRLLCRGGEDKVTLKNTTTGVRVVVKDVNGVVNFNNYKTETVFNGVREITRATYLNPSRPSSGGGTWPSTEYKTIDIYDDSTFTTIIDTIKVKKGDLLLDKLPSAPVKPGFDFVGWYYVDNGTEKKVDSTTKVSDNIKVYAKWKPTSGVTYTVKHIKQDLDGNYTLIAETDILSGVTGSETEAIAKAFEGFTVEPFTQETILADGTTVVEIKYSRNTYSITFNSNGGTPVPDITALYEAPITKPADPIKVGFKFVKWYTDEALTTEFTFDKMPVGGATLYASWVPSTDTAYRVQHIRQNLDGTYSTLLETETKYGTTGEMTEAVAKTYEGFTAESFTQKTIAADATTVVEIKYSRNTYTITFNSNGGTPVSDITALYEAPITKPAQPTKEGYNFGGWYQDSALTTEFTFDKMPYANTTLYAKWTEKTDIAYTVRHVRQNLDGTYSTLIETETKYGTTGEMTAAVAKTYEGFTAESFTQKPILADGTTVVEIKYSRNTYTVKYYIASSLIGLISTEDVPYEGTAVSIPADPTASGKVFIGWYYIDSTLGETEFNNTIPVKGDIDVYAKWTNMFDVAFYMDETLTPPEIAVIQVDEGATLTSLPSDPTKEDYIFEGWAYNDGGTEKVFDTTVTVNSNMQVYAKWKIKQYTVNFYVEYSTAPDASILESSYVADSGSTVPDSEIPDTYVYNGYVKNSTVDPVYATEYKHKIPNEWWYFDTDSSKWTIFDDSVVVKSDIDVFDMSKNISFMVKSTKLPSPASVTVPYNSHTRIADTFKDALYFGRNSVQYAVDHTDAYNKLLEKLANPKIGLIDSDGNILKQKIDIGIYEIIDSDEIQGEIKNYIRLMVKNGGDDLRTVLGFASIPELVSAVGVGTIIEYVDDPTLLEMVKLPAMRNTLIEFMKEKFVSSSVFRDEIIESLILIMSNNNNVMLNLAGYIRAEYNAGNPDVVNLVNNTMHIPDISMIDDATLANEMKSQVASMPEFMAIYITNRINNNDPIIDDCVNDFIDTEMSSAFVGNLKSVFVGDSKIESIINKYLEDDPAEAETLIIDYIESLTDAQKDSLADKIFEKISEHDTYKNFIQTFIDKKAEFEVTSENVNLLLAVANAVNSYTYDGLRDKFMSKFGQIIDLIGEDTVRLYFDEAKNEYYDGAMALANKINDDNAHGTVGTYYYKTSLTFRVNLVADILVPKYNQAIAKIKEKLQSQSKVDYEGNIYLKALVEKDMIASLLDTATEDLEHSGYKLKDDPMVYYDLLYAIVVLSDDALLYYDYVDYDTAFTKLTPYAVKVMNKFVSVVDHFDKTGELPGGINDKLSSISQIADLYSSFEDVLNAVADEILASGINQDYTEGNFKNESIKAVTAAINLILNQFNEYVATGDLPFNADRLVERISQIQAIYDKYGDNVHKVAEKLAGYNFNHAYTEGEVASYEEYVKHIYTLLNEAEDPAYSVDDLYDLINVFFGDILHEFEYTPEYIEGTVDIDAYSAGAKGTNGFVSRFYR